MPENREYISKEKAIQKIRHYCAYQERSHQEVKDKLYGFGLRTTEVEEVLAGLIEDNYLNEERFACQFAGGRFRMKKWGRVKITYELKQHQVSTYNIKKALSSIEETDYLAVLQKLTAEKWASLRGEQPLSKQAKTMQYLLQKGYESNLIKEAIDNCRRDASSPID